MRTAILATLLAAGTALAPLAAEAQATVYIPGVIELSGAGAVSGTNFRDGIVLAEEEINAKGGILGRKIDTPFLDTQSDAGISRALIQKVLDNKPYVILGPVFSGSVVVDMKLTQEAEIPEIVGGEAASITQQGDPYVFRTSFGQQFSMPKIANYLRDELKTKTVAVLWVNNDFGKGGRDAFIKEMKAAQHQGRRRHLHRIGPSRFLGRRGQGQGRQRRRDLRLYQRGGERALPEGGEKAGRQRRR